MQSQAKVRGPIVVAILSIVTLGLYTLYYWYVINRELADHGRARGTDELGTSPGRSLAALVPGVLLIVPAIWTTVTTFKRVQAAQRLDGRARSMAGSASSCTSACGRRTSATCRAG